MKSLLLLSGGMDSISILWWKRPEYALTINYGQMAAKSEINASKTISNHLGIKHIIIETNFNNIGSGDMSGKDKNKYANKSDWWPYRNQLLITIAAMKSIDLDVKKIIIGTVQSDNSHQDGKIEFIKKINDLLNQQEGRIGLEAPAIEMTTQKLIKTSKIPLNKLLWAHSCHKSNMPCGNCRGCNKYYEVYSEIIKWNG